MVDGRECGGEGKLGGPYGTAEGEPGGFDRHLGDSRMINKMEIRRMRGTSKIRNRFRSAEFFVEHSKRGALGEWGERTANHAST